MISIYNKYVMILTFIMLLFIFIYNIFTGSRGSYMDHSKLLWTEALKSLQGVNTKQEKSIKESSGESECRRVVERLTGKKFPKSRPNFLKNTITNSNLELDCYCEELKLAIEYNGRQHYEYVPFFHVSKDAFYNMRYRDDLKARLCKEHGVRLIIVPYHVEDIESFLADEIGI